MAAEKPDTTPDFLPSAKAAKDVRRPNRRPLLAGAAAAALISGGLAYTAYDKSISHPVAAAAAAETDKPVQPAAAPVGIVDKEPGAAQQASASPRALPIAADGAQASAAGAPASGVTGPAPVADVPTDQVVPSLQPFPADQAGLQGSDAARPLSPERSARLEAVQRVRERRREVREAALTAGSSLDGFGRGRASAPMDHARPEDPGDTDMPFRVDRTAPRLALAGAAGAGTGAGADVGEGDDAAPADPGGQDHKRAFLAAVPAADVYPGHTREDALAETELKAGTVIPGVMIGGINSDLPGQIVGQVRQNVFDSATGRYLLIPAGARLVGTYDSSVSGGQSRVLVAWQRVIFPDGSSISLDRMPGADRGGYAGFRDRVNGHTLRLFANALLLSGFSAGVQLSQPRGGGNIFSAREIASAELGRQLGQLGAEMARRGLDQQPTIVVRPGYHFNVMVTRDIILPRWTRR